MMLERPSLTKQTPLPAIILVSWVSSPSRLAVLSCPEEVVEFSVLPEPASPRERVSQPEEEQRAWLRVSVLV